MHYPGHMREAFLAWLEDDMPERATVEVDYEPQDWPAENLLGRMVHCSDQMPGADWEPVAETLGWAPYGVKRPGGRSYGAVAQALMRDRKRSRDGA